MFIIICPPNDLKNRKDHQPLKYQNQYETYCYNFTIISLKSKCKSKWIKKSFCDSMHALKETNSGPYMYVIIVPIMWWLW